MQGGFQENPTKFIQPLPPTRPESGSPGPDLVGLLRVVGTTRPVPPDWPHRPNPLSLLIDSCCEAIAASAMIGSCEATAASGVSGLPSHAAVTIFTLFSRRGPATAGWRATLCGFT